MAWSASKKEGARHRQHGGACTAVASISLQGLKGTYEQSLRAGSTACWVHAHSVPECKSMQGISCYAMQRNAVLHCIFFNAVLHCGASLHFSSLQDTGSRPPATAVAAESLDASLQKTSTAQKAGRLRQWQQRVLVQRAWMLRCRRLARHWRQAAWGSGSRGSWCREPRYFIAEH
eukprot:1161237-Pelagomonas_calceolata.AAC.3